MSRRFILAWLFIVLGVTSARAQVPFGDHLIPTRTALARLGLERNWVGVVPLNGVERLIELSIADNLLFTQTNFANFAVYNADSGQVLWTLNLGTKTGDAHHASANSFAVFVTNSNRLFAIDRRTGHPFWIKELEALPTSATSCDEGRVMVGMNTGKLVAYGLKTKPEKGPERISPSALTLWNWQTNGPITARAQVAGPVVAFGSTDGRAYVCLADAPTMLWRFQAGGEIFSALGTYGTRTLLIPSADKNVYAVDLWTAETNWVFPTGSPVRQEPLVAGEDAYVVNEAGLLTALDPKSGLERWATATHGGRLISVSEKRIYLESHDQDLFIVDRASGKIIADPRATLHRAGVNIRDFTLGVTNSLNDRMYFATPSGMVLCLREIGQVNPRPLRDVSSKPFGYIPVEGIKLPRIGAPGEPPLVGTETAPPAIGPAPTDEKDKPDDGAAAPADDKEKAKDKDKDKDSGAGDEPKDREKEPADPK